LTFGRNCLKYTWTAIFVHFLNTKIARYLENYWTDVDALLCDRVNYGHGRPQDFSQGWANYGSGDEKSSAGSRGQRQNMKIMHK